MICKTDVIQWFKELESYKRIDTMCALLNMCLPFELRFLGTCLEELGRRDSQELRGMELRVNNPQDLAADMVACQKGEPTDKKIRRKMALYLALIRACNRTCVTEIFRTLEGWGERDFMSMNDPDTLQELLLVYTMAANHPVFSFDQQYKCTEIFSKIKENKLVSEQSSLQSHMEQALPHNQLHQQDSRQHLQPSHQEFLQQQVLHAMHIAGQQHSQLLTATPTHPSIQIPQPIPVPFQQGLAKLILPDGSIPHQITNIIPDPNPMGQPAWCRPYQPSVTSLEHPQSVSPSQQSSPSSSRTTSPNRNSTNNMQQQTRNMPQRIGVSLKNVGRPSSETTPPPIGQQQHQPMMQHDIMAPAVKHIEEVVINNDNSGNQLHTLIRNGYTRPGHHPRHKSGNFISTHQQQPQQQSPVNQHFPPISNFSINATLAYPMQNMSLGDGTSGGAANVMDTSLLGGVMNSNKSAGSESGSSLGSSGEASPPETPTLSNTTTNVGGVRHCIEPHQTQQQKHHQQNLNYNKQMGHARLNGRSEKIMSSSAMGGGLFLQSQVLTNAHQPLPQQQSQPLFGGDIILAPGGNAGASNLIQTSLANNNSAVGNSIAVSNTSSNTVSSNNNIVSSGVMLTPNSGLLTSHQYSAPYNYPIAAAPQHLATSSRPPLMSHTPALAQTQFRLVQNCDLIYPYHQAPPNITFLSGPAPPGASPVPLRTSNTAPANSNVSAGIPQLPQQQQVAVPSAILATPSYSSQTVVANVNKPVSCYNCGSQTHHGRECQEASMDDVTRSAIYKLDYSISSNTSSAVGPSGSGNSGGGNGGSSGGGGSTDTLQTQQLQQHHQKQHAIESGGTNLVLSSSALQSTAAVSAINSK